MNSGIKEESLTRIINPNAVTYSTITKAQFKIKTQFASVNLESSPTTSRVKDTSPYKGKSKNTHENLLTTTAKIFPGRIPVY